MVGEICQAASLEDFARQAAGLIAAAAREAVAARGRFVLALTGGRTIQPVYRNLASAAELELRRLLGERTYYFWGDERLVPPDHLDSNYGLARRQLLDELRVPPVHLHPISSAHVDPIAAARLYEEELRAFFGGELSPVGLPIFDLILLGMGPDGHVASLFPGSAALAENSRWVVEVVEPGLPPLVPRVSLTLPLLNQARLVVVLAAGKERVKLARRISAGEPGVRELPAAKLHPSGSLVWLLAGE